MSISETAQIIIAAVSALIAWAALEVSRNTARNATKIDGLEKMLVEMINQTNILQKRLDLEYEVTKFERMPVFVPSTMKEPNGFIVVTLRNRGLNAIHIHSLEWPADTLNVYIKNTVVTKNGDLIIEITPINNWPNIFKITIGFDSEFQNRFKQTFEVIREPQQLNLRSVESR